MNKLLYLLLLFTSIVYSQDSIKHSIKQYAFVKNSKVPNVVYRGIFNPISISVSEAKCFKATGLGLTKNEENQYFLSPGKGKEVEIKIEITLQNDSIIYESKFFNIKDLPSMLGLINEKNCYDCIIKMTKDSFLNGKITYILPDFVFEINYSKVISFDIFLNKNEIISIIGDKIPYDISNKIKRDKRIFISNIKIENPHDICFLKVYPIDILIVE